MLALQRASGQLRTSLRGMFVNDEVGSFRSSFISLSSSLLLFVHFVRGGLGLGNRTVHATTHTAYSSSNRLYRGPEVLHISVSPDLFLNVFHILTYNIYF